MLLLLLLMIVRNYHVFFQSEGALEEGLMASYRNLWVFWVTNMQ